MLPKQNRFRSADFKQMRRARTVHSAHFFIHFRQFSDGTVARAAAVVSGKISRTAVARNLLRRRIYASLRPLLPGLNGLWMVIAAKQGAASLSFRALNQELVELLKTVFSG